MQTQYRASMDSGVATRYFARGAPAQRGREAIRRARVRIRGCAATRKTNCLALGSMPRTMLRLQGCPHGRGKRFWQQGAVRSPRGACLRWRSNAQGCPVASPTAHLIAPRGRGIPSQCGPTCNQLSTPATSLLDLMILQGHSPATWSCCP